LGKKKTPRSLVDVFFFITAIDLAVGVDPATLSKNPLRLKVAVQPNGVDC
jgi:hypothetical protein